MQTFEYTLTDPVGIHARPAALLVKEIKNHGSEKITLNCNGKTANGQSLLSLMALGAKQGQTVTVQVEGINEKGAAEALKAFFAAKL